MADQTNLARPMRNTDVDMIRCAALIGICVVNLPYLGQTPDQMAAPVAPGLDSFAVAVITTLFQSKFFLLFSFIFGWGLGIQMQSAARSGAGFVPRYLRRIAGLLILGVLHACLVFIGDILVLYALLGLLVFALRHRSVRGLMRWAYAMIPVALLSLFVLAIFVDAGLMGLGDPVLGGNFATDTAQRVATWPGTFLFLCLFQGPMAFGAMAAGLAAQKSGFFERGSKGRQRLAKWVPYLLLIGLPLSAMVPHDDSDQSLMALMGLVLMPLSATMVFASYIHLFLWVSERVTLPQVFVSAGQNTLTAYVLQGVLAGLVFGGYGLGLYGDIGHFGLLLLAIAIALASMILTHLLRFGGPRAPLEWVLRRITYLQ